MGEKQAVRKLIPLRTIHLWDKTSCERASSFKNYLPMGQNKLQEG